MIEYRNRAGAVQLKPELGLDLTEEDFEDNKGWCLACGNLQGGVEPDARRYTCEECGAEKVYGLAELALMRLVG